MRRILLTLAALGLAASLHAQQMGATEQPGREVVCPLDSNRFMVAPPQQPDMGGGVDSDGCIHCTQANTLVEVLIVCPRCNYAAFFRDFTNPVPDAKRGELLRMLAKSKYRGVENTLTDIPSWERFRLAADCARVLGNVNDHATMTKYAVYCVRAEACEPSTLDLCRPAPLPQPITPLPKQLNEYYSTRGVDSVISELVKRIADAPKAEEKQRLTLELAMLYERAGYAVKRDETVAKLAEAGADAAVAAPLARFKKMLGIERELQAQLIEAVKARLAKATVRGAMAEDHFLLGDTLRRLGRDKEAVEEYRAARKLMPQPTDTRIYCDYFLTMLAPGEPLPAPEPEKVEAPVVAPETPITLEPAKPEAPKTEAPK